MTAKPKILFLYPALAVDTDFLLKTFELLSDRYNITVVTPERVGFPNLGIAEKTVSAAERQAAAPNVRIVTLPLLHPTHRYARTLYRPIALARVLREIRPDVVHACSEVFSPTLTQAIATLRFLRIPSRIVNFSFENLDWYRFPFSWVGRWNLARIDAVFAVNREAVDEARKFGEPKQVFGSGFACDLALFPFREHLPPTGNVRIGFIGRMVDEKWLEDLIHAVHRLDRDRISILAAGEGPRKESLADIAKNQWVDVEFIGRVSADRLAEDFFTKIDFLVIPSRSTNFWKEQFGRVIVESMASGVPVIGSDSGAIPEVIGEHGKIFREGDAENLAQSIMELLSDPDSFIRYGQKGAIHARENHSLQAYSKKLDVMYSSMLLDRLH